MNENEILNNENIIITVPDYLYTENSENNFIEIDEVLEENQEDEENQEEVQQNEIDYTSLLLEMNERLENIEANTINYTDALQGLLTNTYFLCLPCFTFFIFCLIVLVIKFFKIFF